MTRGYISAIPVFLLLLAVFVRGMIPLGFMPGDLKNHKMGIEICSGLEMKTIFVDTKAPLDNDSKEKHNPCPFAPPILAGDAGVYTPPQFADIAYDAFIPSFRILAKSLPARGKPFFAQGPPALIA